MQEEPPRLAWHRRLPVSWVGGRPALRGILLVVLLLPLVYYGVVPLILQKIDDDVAFQVEDVDSGASRAVAVAAALIRREVDVHGWTPNDPFFMPTAALDNMPNFQTGIVSALGRFAIEMSDSIGRARGSSQVDPDLEAAAGRLKYSGKQWIFDLDVSWAPVATSEEQYRSALRELLQYNSRLASGRAVFERRADNLIATLDRILADIGSSSALIADKVSDAGLIPIDFTADDLFYETKGRLYGYYIILKHLGQDFDRVIREKELESIWDRMLESLREGAELQPIIVFDAAPDALVFPNHLANQGFFLLRARTQMREVTNVLLK